VNQGRNPVGGYDLVPAQYADLLDELSHQSLSLLCGARRQQFRQALGRPRHLLGAYRRRGFLSASLPDGLSSPGCISTEFSREKVSSCQMSRAAQPRARPRPSTRWRPPLLPNERVVTIEETVELALARHLARRRETTRGKPRRLRRARVPLRQRGGRRGGGKPKSRSTRTANAIQPHRCPRASSPKALSHPASPACSSS
jgi:hypothetical protein